MKLNTNKGLIIAGLVLLVLIIGVYSNHWDNGFHFDDAHTIVDNMFIRSMDNMVLFFQDATTLTPLPINQSYRPIITASYTIDYAIAGGLEPFYFHLSTFIWFLLTCVCLFILYRKLSNASDSRVPAGLMALFGTAWFAVHTVNAETINYISARSDVISTVMVLLALILYVISDKSRKFHFYLIPLFIGVLTKPTAVMFAPLLFVYIWLEEGFGPAVRKSWIAFIVSGGLFAFTAYMAPDTYIPGGVSVWEYAITQPYVIARYFVAFFAPIHLSADSDLRVFSSLAEPQLWLGVAFLVSIAFLIIKSFKHQLLRPITFGLLWFIIALAPSSSFVPLAEVMNDHRMFFPFIGLTIAVTWSMGLLWLRLADMGMGKKRLRLVASLVVGAILIGNSLGVYARNQVWSSDETLWYDVTIKSPGNGRGLMNYGLVKMRKGEYEEALVYFERALIYNPYYTYLHFNLGVLKSAMGEEADAEMYFKKAIQLGPGYPEAHYFYGNWLHKQGRSGEAVVSLEQCLRLSAGHEKARNLLMVIYHSLQEWDLLEKLTIGTLSILPDDVNAKLYLKLSQERQSPLDLARLKASNDPTAENFLELSLHHYRLGQFDSCIAVCHQALKINPVYKEAFNNICSAFNEKKMWAEAIEACNEALKIDSTYELATNNKTWAENQLVLEEK